MHIEMHVEIHVDVQTYVEMLVFREILCIYQMDDPLQDYWVLWK